MKQHRTGYRTVLERAGARHCRGPGVMFVGRSVEPALACCRLVST